MIADLERRVKDLENSLTGIGYDIKNAVTTDSQRNSRQAIKNTTWFGMTICLCVATDDPLNVGRIRIYHPIQDGDGATVGGTTVPIPTPDQLRWARPISNMGGFDDSGCTWVPPAGSFVSVIFLNGDLNEPFYLGTVWNRHRGSDGQHLEYLMQYPYMDEYNRLYEGRRNGYNFGDNTGDQVLPPWNTDSYQSYDWDDTQSFSQFLDQREATLPHIYGTKTQGKQWLKFNDGDPLCNYKGKRTELGTARGNIVVLKDDNLHSYSNFGFSLQAGIDRLASGNTCDIIYPCCTNDFSPLDDTRFGCPQLPNSFSCTPQNLGDPIFNGLITTPDNPFQKRSEENKFYEGVNTPAANKVDLPQAGVYIGSTAGNFLTLDDSVNKPSGVPNWESEFNFGCHNIYKGKVTLGEATGHFIRLDGSETNPGIRGPDNGIIAASAGGNFLRLSDHTEQVGQECGCPPNQLGALNGFQVETVSQHRFVMSNEGLKACSDEIRKFSPKSELASELGYGGYCMLRSGYGLQLLMADEGIQTETNQQFILLQSPQITNTERGPHTLIMQEQATGPGFVFLRAGGVLSLTSYDDMLEVVGDEENNPANKFTSVTSNYIVQVKDYYYNHSDTIFMQADRVMFLIAGQDCDVPEDPDQIIQDQNQQIVAAASGTTQNKKFPCIHQAITSKDPWQCPLTGFIHYGVKLGDDNEPILDSRSKRVFLSAAEDDPTDGVSAKQNLNNTLSSDDQI